MSNKQDKLPYMEGGNILDRKASDKARGVLNAHTTRPPLTGSAMFDWLTSMTNPISTRSIIYPQAQPTYAAMYKVCMHDNVQMLMKEIKNGSGSEQHARLAVIITGQEIIVPRDVFLKAGS